MANEWPRVHLGEVASVRSGYSFKSSDWTEAGVPVVKIANVKGGRLAMEGCSFVAPRVAEAAIQFRLRTDDILVGMTGSYIGEVALVRESDLPAVLNQRVGRFSIRDSGRLDPMYLFQVLRSPAMRTNLEALGYGSVQPNISPALIEAVQIPLPPLGDQRKIAAILTALDNKVDVNARMSDTLESMVGAIFKSWFIDFDPGPLNAGTHEAVLRPNSVDLFPDSFVDSELGPVPAGWRTSTLASLSEMMLGGDWGDDEASAGCPRAVRCLRGIDLHSLRTSGQSDTPLRYVAIESARKRTISSVDVIIEASGACGRSLACTDALFAMYEEPVVYSNFCRRIRTGSPEMALYLEHVLNGLVASGETRTYVTGTAMPNLDVAGLLRGVVVVVPPADLLMTWARMATEARRQRLTRENGALAALRDAMLPALIFGQLELDRMRPSRKLEEANPRAAFPLERQGELWP